MKKSIKTIWAVGITLIMLVSMLVVAVPASASTLAWSTAGHPNPYLSNQILSGSNVDFVRVAPNGDVFAVVTLASGADAVYKSVNGGQTWTTTATGGNAWTTNNATAQIADLQVSPSYATDGMVFVLANSSGNVTVYQSSNSGSTFAQLGGNIATAGGTVITGTSLAIQPTYSAGSGEIAVSTTSANVSGATGNVYVWGLNGVLNWTASTFTATNVDMVAFSPLNPIDATMVAVTTNATSTGVRFKVSSNSWDANVPSVILNASINTTSPANTAVGASLAFPSDFNASIGLSRNLYVSLASSKGDVYRVTQLGATALQLSGATAANSAINNIAYKGTYASGTLYAGTASAVSNALNVWYTANANSATSVVAPTWVPNTKAPTGATNAYVAINGNDVYAGTSGTESAFSVSYDSGADFYQIGLIDSGISSISDLAIASPTEWFMATSNTSSGALNSLWKSTDSGSTWLRIDTMTNNIATVAANSHIALSPNFATDNTMYYYNASTIYLSQDGGNTWAVRTYPSGVTNVNQVLPLDQYTLYIAPATGSTIYKSGNNGWTWTKQTVTGASGFYQLKLGPSNAVLAGTNNGMVFMSTDGATWTQQGAAVGAASANVSVAFDANYATNGDIYAGATNTQGIYRLTATSAVAAVTPWFNISSASVVPGTGVNDVVVAPDGTLYASIGTGSVVRALTPTAGVATVPGSCQPAPAALSSATTFLYSNTALALTNTPDLGGLRYVSSSTSNALYALDSANPAVLTFGDTLLNEPASIPAISSPAANAVIQNTAIKVVITPVSGDPGSFVYQVQWNNRNDWLGTGASENITGYPYYSDTLGSTQSSGAAGVAVPAGQTIYYRVRVISPVVGPWSATQNLNTQLATAAAPNAPAMIQSNSLDGATISGGFNVDPMASFFWGAVTGATNYEFQLASDSAMSNLVVDDSGANALGNVLSYTVTSPLSYNTMYYWRVRATSATSSTSWSNVQAFRVMAQPTVAPTSTATSSAPPITITTQPAPTITFTQTQPAPTTITIPPAQPAQQVGPAYIWAIIIIGAVLVIAVIVLIVRTRRSV